jgi:DNA-binding protein HU-beta
MTKKELIAAIQDGAGKDLTKKQVSELAEATFDVIAEALTKEARFAFPGFGTLTVRKRAARTGRNPRTNSPIQIAESKTVAFKPAPELKKSLG